MKLDHMKSRGFELRLEEINRAIEKGLEGRRKPSDRAIIEKWRKYGKQQEQRC